MTDYAPVQPTHEDRITITYSPAPEDNTTVVTLHLNINNTTQEDIDLTPYWDNTTKTFSYELGIRPIGTMIEYSITAWNISVSDGNISVASPVEVLWHQDLVSATSISHMLRRPMLVLFWSTGDRASYDVMTEAFSDERVLNLSASFVCVRVNIDKEPELARQWQVGLASTPTIIFLDNNATETHRVSGPMGSEDLLTHMMYGLGTGPKPHDEKRGMLMVPVRNLLIVVLLLMTILAVIFIKSRWGNRPVL